MSDEDEFFGDDDNENNDIEDEVVLVEDSQASQLTVPPDVEDATAIAAAERLRTSINAYNAFVYANSAEYESSGRIVFRILSDYLPLASQAVYGFNVDENILKIDLLLENYSWTQPPEVLICEHPKYKNHYIGKPLITQVFTDFFSPFYKPRPHYKSASHILSPPGRCDQTKLDSLRKLGFDGNRAENALALFRNDLDKAIEFLRTGHAEGVKTEIQISYNECPLLYLVLELVEAFLDLSDHCCVCRALLTEPGIKPTPCDNELCRFSYQELGVGSDVYREIKRDPPAADLVYTMFACAIDTQYLIPAPSGYTKQDLKSIVNKTPSMEHILGTCKTDKEIAQSFGEDVLSLLRWVLLTNRSQFMSLQKKLEIEEFKKYTKYQFLVLSSTPEKEEKFRELQSTYGSFYLWHGSDVSRWHAIFRNGLKNMSNTPGQANGAVYGEGIYFAPESNTSVGYSRNGENGYKNSMFERHLSIIALCEIAKVPDLKDNGWCQTLRVEEACIVRFLMVNFNGGSSYNVIDNQPTNIPTLRDILEYHAESIQN